MRRVASLALVFGLFAAGVAMVWSGWAMWNNARDNSVIRSLASGTDAAPRASADPRVHYARILFLALRDRIEEAQAIVPEVAKAPAELRSASHFAIGNARMRIGFERIQEGVLDDAVPEIDLAKAAYREALRAESENLQAKVNLELAMRLVRDLPRPEVDADEEPAAQPRRLWTDLPGVPRGEP